MSGSVEVFREEGVAAEVEFGPHGGMLVLIQDGGRRSTYFVRPGVLESLDVPVGGRVAIVATAIAIESGPSTSDLPAGSRRRRPGMP